MDRLKDSLGGNCNTFMMACVWPHPSHTWETLSTLRFAARMKCIETHPVRNSLVSKEPVSAKLLQQLDLLKKELVLRDVINGVRSRSRISINPIAMTTSDCYHRKMPGCPSSPDRRSSEHTDRAISW